MENIENNLDNFGKVNWEDWENENIRNIKNIKNNDNDINFGKIDWEIENNNFGQVNWENIKSLEEWIKPEDGYCELFNFNGIVYFRDSEDYIWASKNNDENIDYIIGRFNNDTETIDELDKNMFEYY